MPSGDWDGRGMSCFGRFGSAEDCNWPFTRYSGHLYIANGVGNQKQLK